MTAVRLYTRNPTFQTIYISEILCREVFQQCITSDALLVQIRISEILVPRQPTSRSNQASAVMAVTNVVSLDSFAVHSLSSQPIYIHCNLTNKLR